MFVLKQGLTIPTSTLEALRSSEHEFYLTGSRRFGQARLTSDYDFFTADTPNIRRFLVSNGFSIRRTPDYGPTVTDVSLVEVWTHVRDRIDVQIRRDVDEFETVCQMVEASDTLPPTEKLARRNYWNMMITAARQAKKLSLGTSERMPWKSS